MKIRKMLLIVALGLGLNAYGELPSEVQALKDKYDNAVKKVVEPINQIYKEELLKLFNKNRTDPTESAKIAEELKKIGVDVVVPVIEQPKESPLEIDKLFIGKKWYSSAGAEYHFLKDGGGKRTYTNILTPFTWRSLPDGMVEVIGRLTPAAKATTWYFRFTNKKTALFGTSKDNIDQPLKSEK